MKSFSLYPPFRETTTSSGEMDSIVEYNPSSDLDDDHDHNHNHRLIHDEQEQQEIMSPTPSDDNEQEHHSIITTPKSCRRMLRLATGPSQREVQLSPKEQTGGRKKKSIVTSPKIGRMNRKLKKIPTNKRRSS